MKNPRNILFLAANPSDMRKSTQGACDANRGRNPQEPPPRPDSSLSTNLPSSFVLIEVFRRHRPQIIHFSGHGSEADEIILESDDGSSRLVGTDTLAELFRLQGRGVRVRLAERVLFETPRPRAQAYRQRRIGMSEAIPDPMAIDFASGLGLAYLRAGAVGLGRQPAPTRLAGLPRLKLSATSCEAVEARGLIPSW